MHRAYRAAWAALVIAAHEMLTPARAPRAGTRTPQTPHTDRGHRHGWHPDCKIRYSSTTFTPFGPVHPFRP
eukprot:2707565-Prymnesium_polylepis.1